jgi:ribonuclease HI
MNYAIQLEFSATNNITEYEGLVNGLRLEKDLNIQ